jgi:hypothetical protein
MEPSWLVTYRHPRSRWINFVRGFGSKSYPFGTLKQCRILNIFLQYCRLSHENIIIIVRKLRDFTTFSTVSGIRTLLSWPVTKFWFHLVMVAGGGGGYWAVQTYHASRPRNAHSCYVLSEICMQSALQCHTVKICWCILPPLPRTRHFFFFILCTKARVSDPDPDSIRSVDPDPYSESGSGSRREKLPSKVAKIEKFHIFKCCMFSFESWRLLF